MSSNGFAAPSYFDHEEEEDHRHRVGVGGGLHLHHHVPLPPAPPLRVDFLDVTAYGLPPHCLALSSLPGCRFRYIFLRRRKLQDATFPLEQEKIAVITAFLKIDLPKMTFSL